MSATASGLRELRTRLIGRAAARGEATYGELAAADFPNLEVPWNPDVVIACATVADVVAGVGFAADNDLKIAIRNGGVGWVGAPPGTVLLDMAGLAEVAIDTEARTVRAQAGAIWRDVHRELAPHGLAAAGPQFPRLGIAGHVLGGGHGWLTRKLGWASDTLRSVDLVTARGDHVHASAREHPDLFWALRGAGHNFGVAVTLELELIELNEVSFGLVWFAPDRSGDAMRFLREWVEQTPDELTTIISAAHPPPGWTGPPELAEQAMIHVIVCHCGARDQAVTDLAPLTSHPGVFTHDLKRMPWPKLATGNDVFASGVHRRSRMHYTAGLSDPLIELTERRMRELEPSTFISIHYYAGAVARVAEDATAMSHRDKAWNYMVSIAWEPGDDGARLRCWQDAFLDDVAGHSYDAYYVNYLFDEPQHVQAAYSAPAWARLRALKSTWDPGNLFTANQNVPPGRP
jgi:FAD/FMN-containing dehydrogenase